MDRGAARPQKARQIGDDAAIVVETVGAGKKCAGRLVIGEKKYAGDENRKSPVGAVTIRVNAANLAFVVGSLTSRDAVP